MDVLRIATSTLSLFKTFDGYRIPEFLDIQTQSENLGLLEDLPNLGLAIVGTRYPQKRSIDLLDRSLLALRGSGLIVISGFARGVDSAAHELAIKNGLSTLAILGCGIDVDYPRGSLRLRREIIDSGGMILSPFERGSSPLAHTFHHRNSFIAGFSKAVWVVEASEVSGTLNTASWAQKYNRDLYATPCFPDDPFFRGNQKLLSRQNTDRYPLAEAFFNSQTLALTWPDVVSQDFQSSFDLNLNLNKIQKWILSIQAELGTCESQALLKHALSNGMTNRDFFQEIQRNLESGLIVQHKDGTFGLIQSGIKGLRAE